MYRITTNTPKEKNRRSDSNTKILYASVGLTLCNDQCILNIQTFFFYSNVIVLLRISFIVLKQTMNKQMIQYWPIEYSSAIKLTYQLNELYISSPANTV